jgi:hypothetical protein
MSLVVEYRAAQSSEELARLRRILALRAMSVSEMSQRKIAESIAITQPAVSQQFKFAPELDSIHPEMLVSAAAPILTVLARDQGYSRLAVFGSVGRGQARMDSDIDLVDYTGLTPNLDGDILREAVLL